MLLNGAPLAVRSSGVAEDLEGASVAGQYENILDVRGYDALVDAIRHCWASAFSARIAAYKSNTGQNYKASMAVLVQILVNADAAGVAFTANPVNGRRGGLNKLDLDMRVFAYYHHDHDNPNSLSDNWVRSFYEDSSGAIWIGTADKD